MVQMPHMDIKKEFAEGTLKPSRILQHHKKGLIVKWNIASLDAFEERIISYKIKSKLSILGTLTLPPMTVTCKDKQGKGLKVVSHSETVKVE